MRADWLPVDAAPAQAAAKKIYTTTDNVWLHKDSGLGDKGDLIKVMPKGTKFTADCYVDDTPIGPRNNPAWLHGKDQKGTAGYFADYYSDSKWNKNNTLHDQGLPFCDKKAAPSKPKSDAKRLQPAEKVPRFVSYNRNKAAKWALAHAKDTPPNAGSCTWFVSNALWKGGVKETDQWNDDIRGIKRDGIRQGTDFAWKTPDFKAYMDTLPYVDVKFLGYLKSGSYNIPKAKKGDIIIYDWNGKNAPDHAAVVTGFAKGNPKYPLVSGWSEDGRRANKYNQRGWTWSKKNNSWIIEAEPGTRAWLVHIITEDEAIN